VTVFEDQFFRIPDPEDAEYWERVIAAGAHNPEPQTVNGQPGYTWIDLTDTQYATPPEPPAIEGILYAGRRHVISGPPESTKTLVAYLLLLSALRQDQNVGILDFEMGPHAAVTLLRELGATDDELAQIHYAEPDQPPTSHDIARLTLLGVQYVLIDAAAGAYDASGLGDNDRKDVEQFAGRWIRPLWQNGVATIVIDHVVKNVDARGKFAIGSERKAGQADVHIGLEALKPLHRGGAGMVKVTVHKDRPGHLPRPTVAIIKLESDPATHAISTIIEPPETIDPAEPIKHTIYAERVSRTLEEAGETMSQTQVTEATEGKDIHIHQAIAELAAAGHLSIENGPRNAKLITLITPYPTTPSHPFPTPSGSGHLTTPSPLPSPTGEAGVREGVSDDTGQGSTPSPVDVYDPDTQQLLDQPDY
jgi:hypothetical protein